MSEEAAAAATTPPAATAAEETPPANNDAEGTDTEEKPECGFCVFMKAGGCSEAFEAWSRCVDSAREAEKKDEEGKGDAKDVPASASSPSEAEGGEGSAANPDFATRCRDATLALQRCMESHRDYYSDFLADAEEAVAERTKEKEEEKQEDQKKGE